MTNSFKCPQNVKLIKILKSSSIGKNVIKKTGISIKDIVKNFCLEVPIKHISGSAWTITWSTEKIKIKPECFLDIEMFMKQAWYYSSVNSFGTPIHKYVDDELIKFELGIIAEKYLNQKKVAAQADRVRIPTLHAWIKEELIENPKIQTKQLWFKLPESSKKNGEGFYRDGDKVYCVHSSKSLKIRAFYKNVKFIKEKIALSGATCNQI